MEQNRFSRTITWVANLFLLNAAWLLCSLPMITIFPSTAAMFGVIREWQRLDDVSVVTSFLEQFKKNFVQSFLLGGPWVLVGTLMVVNFQLIGRVESGVWVFLFATNAFALAIYMFTTIYFFPVLVHYDLRWFNLVKYSFILGMGRLPTTLLCLLIISVVLLATLALPLLLMFSGSVTAYLVYHLCSRSFPPEPEEKPGE